VPIVIENVVATDTWL